jgi:hypothetical protein
MPLLEQAVRWADEAGYDVPEVDEWREALAEARLAAPHTAG